MSLRCQLSSGHNRYRRMANYQKSLAAPLACVSLLLITACGVGALPEEGEPSAPAAALGVEPAVEVEAPVEVAVVSAPEPVEPIEVVVVPMPEEESVEAIVVPTSVVEESVVAVPAPEAEESVEVVVVPAPEAEESVEVVVVPTPEVGEVIEVLTPEVVEPEEPVGGNRAPRIDGTPASSINVGDAFEFVPDSDDPDNDTLRFSIDNKPEWATFNSATGALTGVPAFTDVGRYDDVMLHVSDSVVDVELGVFSIAVTMDEVELAVASGDASVVSHHSQLEDALLSTLDSAVSLNDDAMNSIFNLTADGIAKEDGSSLTAIDWNPTHDAALLISEFGENSRLLVSNSTFVDGYEVLDSTMAVIGENSARYIVLGSNPMRTYRRNPQTLNEQMHQFLENSLAWLMDRGDLKAAPFNVVMAQMDQSYYFPDELGVREWIDERFDDQARYNERNACDGVALSSCITADTDLLIVSRHMNTDGQEQIVATAVANAMALGVPVLYMHWDGGRNSLSDALFPLFDVRYFRDNYWRKQGFSTYDPTDVNGTVSDEIAAVRRMATNFRNDAFVIDWDDCDDENCNANVSLNDQFWDGARFAESAMRQLDERKVNIFDIQGKYRFSKLLALLGDSYRGQTSFPMDRVATPTSEFLRAFYGDMAAYQYRSIVGVWSDLGNFARADYSHIVPTSRTVDHTSKRNFKSTGAYALPGQTVTVTRNDMSDVAVTVFVNSLRNGSTHMFANSGYKRPRVLQTQKLSLEPGETIQFTSHTGGPIHLGYDTNDLPVTVVFDNIGEHAYWRNAADNASFDQKLYANELDWAEIAAPSFEVHSTREKMVASMANDMFGDDSGTPQELVDAVMRYVHNFPHVLAGFQGPGIDVVDEIHQFAVDNGLGVSNLDIVKHMNADQATCGYGCSGNPYDAYWSFSPIGHGDIHELGHGLERGRFRFTGWPGHAITNFYSYYTKSQYFKDTGEDPSCQSLPFESHFNVLQDSFADADPAGYVKANLWNDIGWSDGTAMIIQLMMAAEDNGALMDGWHLLARMHIIEREYQKAIRNDTDWLALRAGIGMGQYERADAQAMSPEDWLLIVVSHATGFDHRAYFDVWAHTYSGVASAQVEAMSLPSMPLNYYVSSGDGFCEGQGFDGMKLPLDGGGYHWPADR